MEEKEVEGIIFSTSFLLWLATRCAFRRQNQDEEQAMEGENTSAT